MARPALPYKPRIFRQGLALVAVPLSVGTCVLMFLNHIWFSAETLALEEQRQSQLVEKFSNIFKQWSLLSGSALGGAVEEKLQSNLKNQQLWLWYSFVKLKNETKQEEPETYKKVLRLEKICTDEVLAFSRLPRGTEGLSLELAQQLPKTFGKIYQLRSEVKRILGVEADELRAVREKQEKSFETLKLYAYCFTAGNLVLALVLVYLFSRSISSRMRVLTENAALLPRSQIPEKHLIGNDELAYLDKVLSSTAETLHEAAEHRRSILGMVAHDMRSPLMSAQASIQMVEELGGEYSLDAYKALESAHENLSSILQFVQRLLTVQKQEDEQGAASAALDSKLASTEIKIAESGTVQSNKQLAVLAASPIAMLREFFFRPKIFQKGLLIVMAPLLLQIAFLLFVNQQILITQTLAKAQQRCAEITVGFNIINLDMVRGSAAQGMYLLTSSVTAQKLAAKIFREIPQEYDRLAGIVSTDTVWKPFIEVSKLTAQHQIDQILAVSPSSDNMQKFQAFAAVSEIKERSPEAYKNRQIGNRLFQENTAYLDKMVDEQMALASSIGNLFGYGILANFIVAIAMLSFFSKNITARLNILVDNAARLGRREELHRTVSGTDEIAYLGLILQQAQGQMDSASRQRALMMASLAEQMRVPLLDAKLQLESFSALTETSLKETPRKAVARSHHNIERVLVLVEDLLTMETLETGKVALEISSSTVRTLAEEALSTVTGLARKKNISLANNCEPCIIKADKARLVQVLINYLSNAIKFSADNTAITVSSKETAESLRVCVIDQGTGMDSETRNHVFEKFFQAGTEQKKQGFGLGLAICQLIVHSHGGSLGVESEPGKGSTFWFEIPL